MKSFLMIAAGAALALPAAAHADHHGRQGVDADGDGIVTMAEVEAHTAQRFARLDADGNGAITQAEIEQMRAMMHERRAERMAEGGKDGERRKRRGGRGGQGQMFERADSNGDGQVTLAEFQAPALERFAKHDTNNDGAIDADERAAAREARKAARGSRGL